MDDQVNSMEAKFLSLARRRGFSLVELVVVLLITAILIGLTGPSLVQAITGSSLTRAASIVQHNLEEAHQYALSLQNVVQVRFYRNPPVSGNFSAVQLVELVPNVGGTGSSSVALSKVNFLPAPNIMISTAVPSVYSSLFKLPAVTPIAGTDPTVPGWGTNYDYIEVGFYPSGGTDLTPAPPTGANGWYVTVASSTMASAPVNYCTIQVDPMTGKVTFYHP